MRKSAVIYYSQTGITKAVADKLAERYASDVHAIKTKEAYKGYLGAIIRAGKEMLKKETVEITTPAADLSGVEVVFVGYPIWYGDMPVFVKDYLEKCNIRDRIVVPFATSGASGIDKSVKTLRRIAPKARVRRPFVTSKAKKGDLERWLEDLDVQMES
ncbi:MAG TPA: hypothetical protein DCG37_01210 [Lachnospiraceae bacterium]|nr:hypothetical protein [Lachnospiraceae bacterium]